MKGVPINDNATCATCHRDRDYLGDEGVSVCYMCYAIKCINCQSYWLEHVAVTNLQGNTEVRCLYDSTTYRRLN